MVTGRAGRIAIIRVQALLKVQVSVDGSRSGAFGVGFIVAVVAIRLVARARRRAMRERTHNVAFADRTRAATCCQPWCTGAELVTFL